MSSDTITVPILINGDGRLAEIHLHRVHVGPEGQDTYTWEWGIVDHTGYRVIDSGVTQHAEHMGIFALLYKILGFVLCQKGTQK